MAWRISVAGGGPHRASVLPMRQAAPPGGVPRCRSSLDCNPSVPGLLFRAMRFVQCFATSARAWPNLAVNRTRRFIASTWRVSARRAGYLDRWGSWCSRSGVSCLLRSEAVPTLVAHRSPLAVSSPHRLRSSIVVHPSMMPMPIVHLHHVSISQPHRLILPVVLLLVTVPCVN